MSRLDRSDLLHLLGCTGVVCVLGLLMVFAMLGGEPL